MAHQLFSLGDHAVLVQLGTSINYETHLQVKAFSAYLEKHPLPGMVEFIPAYTTVTIFYDPMWVHNLQKRKVPFETDLISPYDWYCQLIAESITQAVDVSQSPSRIIEIPVCYGNEWGPDLSEVANHHQLSEEEVISIHSEGEYLVYMIGFAPGFPYIGGMSDRIATPRRKSPRLAIPSGSVGIAGKQTGIYPMETPGGWQIIGRTPVRLFRPEEQLPSLLQSGDTVHFNPITLEEFREYEEGMT